MSEPQAIRIKIDRKDFQNKISLLTLFTDKQTSAVNNRWHVHTQHTSAGETESSLFSLSAEPNPLIVDI